MGVYVSSVTPPSPLKCLPKDFDTVLAEGSADEVDDVALVDFEFSDVDFNVPEGGVTRG